MIIDRVTSSKRETNAQFRCRKYKRVVLYDVATQDRQTEACRKTYLIELTRACVKPFIPRAVLKTTSSLSPLVVNAVASSSNVGLCRWLRCSKNRMVSFIVGVEAPLILKSQEERHYYPLDHPLSKLGSSEMVYFTIS